MARKKTTEVQKVTKKIGKAAPKVEATDSGLAQVSELARLQWEAIMEVAQIEDDLKAAKERLKRIAEDDLPTAMIECDIKKFETPDGLQVSWAPAYTAGIALAHQEAAFEWLKDNGFDGLIKLDVGVHFERGDQAKAQKLADRMVKKGIDCTVKQFVHPQTLKSFVRERMEDTESEVPFPQELFGARPYNVAKVKPKK